MGTWLRSKLRTLKDPEAKFKALFVLYATYEITYIVFGVSRINTFFNTSSLTFGVNLVVLIGLMVLILTNRYTLEEFILISLGIAMGLYAFYALKLNVLFMCVMFMAAAKSIDINLFIKKDFKLRTLLVGSIIIANRFGLIPSVTGLREGTITIVRDSLGFGQYNITGALIMICVLEYLYLNFGETPNYGYGLIAVIIVLMLVLTNSRGSMLAAIIYSGASWFYQYKTEMFEKVVSQLQSYSKYVFGALTVISISVVAIFNYSTPFWQFINRLTSDRVNILNQYLAKFGIPFLPQQVSDYRSAGIIVMDNIYVTLAIQYGIIVLVLFIVYYYLLCQQAVLKNNFALVIMAVTLMIFGMIESTFFIVGVNITVMMVFSNLDSIKQEKLKE